MDFYLINLDGGMIHFPINPEHITCQTGNRTQTFEPINLGEIVLPRGRMSTRFTLEGFFPGEARKNDPKVKNWVHPKELTSTLSLWRNQGATLRLLVTETPINHNVIFDGDDSFEHDWKGGHGDCWYTIRLVEARDLIVRTEAEASQKTTTTSQQTARSTPTKQKTYTVKSGDSLWTIAKKLLGDGGRWKELYNANKSTIGKDPNRIYPGQTLRIP